MKRVYITDDDAMIRRLLKRAFDHAGLITTTFESGRAFLEEVDRLDPGVLILDIRMAEMSGLEVLEEMGDRTRIHAVLMLTSSYDVATAVRAIHAGAIDFIEKPASISDLISRVGDLHCLMAKWENERSATDAAQSRLSTLSAREKEVGTLLAAGFSNKEIALKLELSPRTIEAHRARIIRKLKLRSSSEIVRLFAISTVRS